MTYRGIDKLRFETLIRDGLTGPELQNFVKAHRAQLIIWGAKADNLPNSHGRAAKLVAGLPQAAEPTLTSWLRSLVGSETNPLSPDALVLQLLEVEHDMRHRLEDSSALFRMLLKWVSSDDCPDIVVRYLRSKLELVHQGVKAETVSLPRAPTRAEIADVVRAVLHPAEILVQEASPVLLAAARAAAEISGGEALRLAIDAKLGSILADDGDRVADIVSRTIEDRSTAVKPKGVVLVATPNRTVLEDVDPEAVRVIGYCKKIAGGARFVEVIGLLGDSGVELLAKDVARRLLPDTGDAIYFPGTNSSRAPEQDEFGIWTVQSHDIGKPTKFKIVGWIGPVYEVVSLPHSSEDEDLVRRALIARGAARPGARVVFQLSDGLIVRLPGDFVDPATFDYDRPLDAWDSLSAFAWGAKRLVAGALPAPSRKYECAPIASVIRRAIQSHRERGALPPLTHRQVQDFVKLIEESEGGMGAVRAKRIGRELSAFVDSGRETASTVQALLETPQIQLQIEADKQRVLDEFRTSKADLVAEVERLRKEKSAVAGEVEERRVEAKQLSGELAKSIKKTFDQAREAGVAKLSEAAFFQGVLGRSPEASVEMASHSILFETSVLPRDESLLEDALRARGMRKPTAHRWALVLRACTQTGLMVAFKGSSAPVIAESVVRCLSRVSVAAVDIPLGLTTAGSFTKVLGAADADALLIRNANLSPFEVYIKPLQREALTRLAGAKDGIPRTVVLELADGVTALPASSAMLTTMVVFDCDAPDPEPYDGEASDFVPDVRDRMEELAWIPGLFLEAVAQVVARIKEQDVAFHAGALGLLNATMVTPLIERHSVEREL